MKHSQKAAGGLVTARSQPAKLLEATEKAFDFIAVAVQVAVNHALGEAVFFCWESRLGPRGPPRWPPRWPPRRPYRRLCRPARCLRPWRRPARPPPVGNRPAGRAQAPRAMGCPTRRPLRAPWWSTRRGCGRGLRPRRGFFLAARRLRTGPPDGRIAHDPVQSGPLHGPQQALPNAFLGPPPAAFAQRVVLAKTSRQRAPSASVARYPEHRIEKAPVTRPGTANVARFTGYVRHQSRPSTRTDLINTVHKRKYNCPHNLVRPPHSDTTLLGRTLLRIRPSAPT